MPFDRDLVLPHTIAKRAAENPDGLFYQEVGGRSLTWGEFHAEVLRWASAYGRLGVSAGQHVVTMLPNSITATEAWLGLAWLRSIEVPLNVGYKGPMLEYTVNNSRAEVAVVAQRHLLQFSESGAQLERLRTIVVPDAGEDLPEVPFKLLTGDEFFSGVETATELAGPEYWDTACIIYTSGTTGPSKGVLVPWPLLYQIMRLMPDGALNEDSVWYTCFPQFHVGGKSAPYGAAVFNTRLVLREAFSPAEFWSDVREYGATATGLAGPMASFLMQAPSQPGDSDNPMESIMMGPLVANFEEFAERFDVRVATGFGMTEIGGPLASQGWDVPNALTCGTIRTGYPGYEVRVVDEHDEPVAPGVVGELIIRTEEPWNLNSGYYNMPEATAEAWRNGWFHTGDGFKVDEDGNFYFVDRLKDAIRRRGENISSFEVEAYVMRHPAVSEAAAVAAPSEHTEDDVKVVVVRMPGEEVTPEELIEFLIPIMPRFMIPRYVEFVDELPKTDTVPRVRKVVLREDILNENTWDREAAGIVLPK